MRTPQIARWLGLSWLLLVITWSAQASWLVRPDAPKFLPVTEAFVVTTQQDTDTLRITWSITPAHYLYQSAFQVRWPGQSEPLKAADLALNGTPQSHDDPMFGRVTIYRDLVTLTLPWQTAQGGEVNAFEVTYQGCADAGLCYPPQTQTVTRTTVTDTPSMGLLDEARGWRLLLLCWLLGVGLTFTPCVLPMMPIVSALISGAQQSGQSLTWQRGLGLSAAYVLGMSLIFTVLGLLVSALGVAGNLTLWLQQPWALMLFAGLFLVLAGLLWFGRGVGLPAFLAEPLQRWQNRQQGGAARPAFLLGAVSALVVSPCVSAPLAAVLLIISQSGDWFLGAAALFALAWGMGTPLLMLGAGGGRWLPRSGPWLEATQQLFALLLLGVAVLFFTRLLTDAQALGLWAAWLALLALWITRWPTQKRWGHWVKHLGQVLLLIAAGVLCWQSGRSAAPQAPSSAMASFQTLTQARDVDAAIQAAQAESTPVLVYVTADWCVSCQVMKRTVFLDPAVQSAWSNGQRIAFDITETRDDQLDWLQRHQLYGPPAFLLWTSARATPRIQQGEMSRDSLLQFLTSMRDRPLEEPSL